MFSSVFQEALDKLEAYGLCSEVKELEEKSSGGDNIFFITHASDSTTKIHIGKFQVSGLHINKDTFLSLPTIPIAGEKHNEVADQVAVGFEILGAASGKSPSEIYSKINMHLTDSVDHNKSIAKDVSEKFNLNKEPGQVFCSSHTNLGFSRAINTGIHQMEVALGIGNMLQGFLSAIEYQSKNGSLIGQFVDCVTRLESKELQHKPWNHGKAFERFCKEAGFPNEMFLYKDERFSCFPAFFSREILHDYLVINPDVDNKLACSIQMLIIN